MIEEIKELEIRNIITIEDKQILKVALDGINGWNFNPIAVVTNEISDYYFICKVKTIIENLQMKMAKSNCIFFINHYSLKGKYVCFALIIVIGNT